MKPLPYKLIVTDLDGTLVKSGTNELSQTTIGIITGLKKQGIFFSIATGRSWQQTRTLAGILQINLPVIVQAGAVIVDPVNGKNIRIQPLGTKLERKLRYHYQSRQVDLFCLDESGVYYTTRINTKGGEGLSHRYDETCIIREPKETSAAVIKYLYIGPESNIKQLAEQIARDIKPYPNLVLWPPGPGADDWFLEVFDPRASKGQAVQWLAEYLQIDRKQVIAFGDGYNDIDLLQWAGLGAAIDGAPLAVTATADLVIPRPESEGVARFLTGEISVARHFIGLNPTRKIKLI